MHLEHLEVSNFRALDSATLPDLPANIVIAGPNGCGKSTIFDAIRLWKSAYGGYIGERVFNSGSTSSKSI